MSSIIERTLPGLTSNDKLSRNITEDKMLSHITRVFGDNRPITADFFLTNYCNNRCPYCTYRRWDMGGRSHAVSFEEFQRYAGRLRELGVLGIILTGGGEPTLAPDFDRITAWMTDIGQPFGINTNFNEYKLAKPDYIKVSLDGWDEDSYEQHRGLRAYQKVVGNIRAYADWKAANSPHTTLGIQMVAESPDDVERFYETNAALPVDYIAVRPVESSGGRYYLKSGNLETAQKIIRTVEEIARRDDRVALNFKWKMLTDTQESCVANWAQIAVNEYGQVMYCCHKPYEIIGHIMDEDILEKKHAALTDMRMCDVPCRMTAPNQTVAALCGDRKDASFI